MYNNNNVLIIINTDLFRNHGVTQFHSQSGQNLLFKVFYKLENVSAVSDEFLPGHNKCECTLNVLVLHLSSSLAYFNEYT